MQFIDLAAQYRALQTEIDAGVHRVLEHGKYIMGPEVAELEAALAAYVGAKHCVTCSNGTDALLMPLMAWGVGPGDAVFCPPFTFNATAEVVALLGATTVFADIDPATFNLDPDALEAAVRKVEKEGKLRPVAVIPVDLFGQPADYDALEPIARKHGLKLLEDAAQGFGGAIRGKRAGAFGDAAATSFFPAKPLGCYGDGGAVFTDDDALAGVLRSIRVHGQGTDKYDNIRVGLNARLDTIQAAVLIPKLKAFAAYELEARDRWATKYSSLLSDRVTVPVVKDGYVSSWAQYTVMARDTAERDAMQAKAKAAGVPTMVYYSRPLHLQTAYAALGHRPGDFPASEAACARVFSLPMHPYLDDATVEAVCRAILG